MKKKLLLKSSFKNYSMIICSNKMNKTLQSNFFKKKLLIDNPSQKLTPEHSIANYSFKNARSPLFNKTSNLFFSYNSANNTIKNNKFSKIISDEKLVNIKSKKIHKSLSELFKNNDIDFVRNLNIDSLSQFNNNLILKKNLKNSNKNYFEIEKQKKFSSIFGKKIKFNIDQDEIKKRNERFPKMNRNLINKSYNKIKEGKRKSELNDNVEKDLMNRFKILKKNDKLINMKKKEYFLRIKEIDKEIIDINEENIFIKAIFLRELKEQSKDKNNGMDILDEIIKYKIKMKEKNNENNKSFLYVLDMKILSKKNNNKLDEFSNSIKNKSKEKIKKENSKNKIQTNNNNLELCERNQKISYAKKKFNDLIKIQDNRINELLQEKKNIQNKLKKLGISLEEIKKEIKEITNKLMMSYKESLYKGTYVKNEGLVWLIKSIWTLGQNVPLSFMPDFLDCESIDYLFKLARKQNLIEKLRKQILEIKTKLKKKLGKNQLCLNPLLINDNKENINKNLSVKEKLLLIMEKESKMSKNGIRMDIYNDLVNKFKKNKINFEIEKLPETQMINKLNNELEKIKKEIVDSKQKEIKRIYNCFLDQNYENKFHTNIETVLAALIGYEEKDAEVNKFNSIKKNYISDMKRVRFFDLKYLRKIMSAV